MNASRAEQDNRATDVVDTKHTDLHQSARLSVAPMMDWTDRHCRYFHRLLSRETLLYTEMVVAAGIVRGDPERMLRRHEAEQPVALQLGGSDPDMLAAAVRIALEWRYDEINLNVGCPSDRVQGGSFGACLMREPALVADCVAAMIEAAGPDGPEITVKCRLGIDDQDPRETLPEFIHMVAATGCRRFIIHARKAWLKGLSPKENRMIPPLDYAMALQIKRDRPDLSISVNGGIDTLDAAESHLADGFDGVMIGRAAYHNPYGILAGADARIYGCDAPPLSPEDAVRAMEPYITEQIARGGRLHLIVRHMLGMFAGRPGARRWRRTLSDLMHRDGAGFEVVETALAAMILENAQ